MAHRLIQWLIVLTHLSWIQALDGFGTANTGEACSQKPPPRLQPCRNKAFSKFLSSTLQKHGRPFESRLERLELCRVLICCHGHIGLWVEFPATTFSKLTTCRWTSLRMICFLRSYGLPLQSCFFDNLLGALAPETFAIDMFDHHARLDSQITLLGMAEISSNLKCTNSNWYSIVYIII